MLITNSEGVFKFQRKKERFAHLFVHCEAVPHFYIPCNGEGCSIEALCHLLILNPAINPEEPAGPAAGELCHKQKSGRGNRGRHSG